MATEVSRERAKTRTTCKLLALASEVAAMTAQKHSLRRVIFRCRRAWCRVCGRVTGHSMRLLFEAESDHGRRYGLYRCRWCGQVVTRWLT